MALSGYAMRRLIFVALPAIVLFLASCDADPMSLEAEAANPFVGTWVNEFGEVWTLTKTTVVAKGVSGDPRIVGIYTFNDTHIIITATEESPYFFGMLSHPFVIRGGVLILDGFPLSRKAA